MKKQMILEFFTKFVFTRSIIFLIIPIIFVSYFIFSQEKQEQKEPKTDIEILGEAQIQIQEYLKKEYETQEKLKNSLDKTNNSIKEKEEELKSLQEELEKIVKGYQEMQPEYNSKGEKHTDIIIPKGGNKKSKVKDFVNKNCVQDIVNVFDEVYEYAEKKGIKGETPFVIALADSGCGKYLSTPHNYGNVGNNDRGNRRGFFNAVQGMNAITNTITNKYIGGNEYWWQLSGGGRVQHGAKNACGNAPAPYKCYATSMENWQNNTDRALRSIYGEEKEKWMKFKK